MRIKSSRAISVFTKSGRPDGTHTYRITQRLSHLRASEASATRHKWVRKIGKALPLG